MHTDERSGRDPISVVSSLDDPVRGRLYDYVGTRDQPVAREDAAAAVGISRTLAAYHLDKLVEAGLLVTSYARPAGRGGPGAGRPAKRYARTQREVTVSVPPRAYGLLAGVLAEAVAADQSGTVRAAVARAALEAGRAAGGQGLMEALRACGFEPSTSADGGVELRNCPFHQLAHEHTELVCGLNLHLVQGILEASGHPSSMAALAPRPGRCCVLLRPLAGGASAGAGGTGCSRGRSRPAPRASE